MAKRFEDPVTLPLGVFVGLETVQGLHRASMEDHQAVREIAARIGYPETAIWIEEHRQEYFEGLFKGFAAAE
jgi:hypothetical protein